MIGGAVETIYGISGWSTAPLTNLLGKLLGKLRRLYVHGR